MVQAVGKPKGARFTPFEVGQIQAHAQPGWGPVKIAAAVRKPHGEPATHEGLPLGLLPLGPQLLGLLLLGLLPPGPLPV